MTNFPLHPNQFRPYAEKAVLTYVRTQFPHYFTREEKEDIVSDVVLRMLRAQASYDPGKGALATWVGTIARNAVRSAARSKWNRTDISADWDDDTALRQSDRMSADGELLLEELQEDLFSRLRMERDRRFLAWQIDGLDAAEMAVREGIPVEQVHLVLFRMRQRLRAAA